MKRILFISVLLLLLAGAVFVSNTLSRRTGSIPQIGIMQTPTGEATKPSDAPRLAVVAKNLEIPWGIAFLPDQKILLTERPGRVKLIDGSGNISLIATIEDVKHIGEGGLLGVALHPNFSINKTLYLYYTYEGNDNQTLNRVTKYTFDGTSLTNRTILIDAIPGAPNHNGGRIKFGPDKFLYVTTGDAQNPSLSQNTGSLAGKILRVTDQGKAVPGNLLGLVYSYGHRNPQGLAWDDKKQLYATEHGQSAQDELNKIELGKNYGWPTIRGDEKQDGMVNPIIHSGSTTWAPSGTAFLPAGRQGLKGSIFFAGLRGEALYEVNKNLELKTHLKGELGRIREVVVGPDNLLYLTTSNRDGRGVPDGDDDRVIRVNPAKL